VPLSDNGCIDQPFRKCIMQFTPVILVHMLAASGALVIGGITLRMKKGTSLHRLSGRVWVLLMLVAVLVSFGIRSTGHFSWIHLLSLWILFVIGMGLYSIFRRNVAGHTRWMRGAYIGLVVAGAFTFMPDRRLGHLVWSAVGYF
jgi:uncharacterized membrane protein